MTSPMPSTMRAITVCEPGGPDVLEVSECPLPQPAPNQILAKVTAAGVNGPDLLQRQGVYPPPEGASELLGLEVSGTVAAVGERASRWRVGDRICALTHGGGYAEYVAIDADHCLPVPEGVSEVDAAGLPETYFTVWSNVFLDHDVSEQALMLVHGGAGGIGSTAVQLGRAMGLRVFATVSSVDAAEFVLGLGAERAINYREEDFVDVCREAGGADITLDIVGGDYIARNFKAARHDGRIIQLAFRTGSKIEINLMPIMLKRLHYAGSTLRSRPAEFKARTAEELERAVWPKFASGEVGPVTHAVLPLERADEAHRLMESARHRGKILLTP
ncbi:MAG: NAD(P)H-quinone oxidoreductase [Boseongicola sp. SB0662_bin_57]|nr:NAD(P)H-quinone oxidoreductase [Boseongicola sp. SB0662_bin_57]